MHLPAGRAACPPGKAVELLARGGSGPWPGKACLGALAGGGLGGLGRGTPPGLCRGRALELWRGEARGPLPGKSFFGAFTAGSLVGLCRGRLGSSYRGRPWSFCRREEPGTLGSSSCQSRRSPDLGAGAIPRGPRGAIPDLAEPIAGARFERVRCAFEKGALRSIATRAALTPVCVSLSHLRGTPRVIGAGGARAFGAVLVQR